ncbi:hypothetical protein KC963_04700 [Candidatus Saccharibacteria bacterium]|nr:hypothetical protein [Candidatus Saccharibacteria bacterium]
MRTILRLLASRFVVVVVALMMVLGLPMASLPVQAADASDYRAASSFSRSHEYRLGAVSEQTEATSLGTAAASIQSDDFNSCTLDPRWEFINPLNDGTVTTNGTQVLLSVPEGISHNVFDAGIPAPRIMQMVSDTDFEIVVKFESEMAHRFQVQGIIIEQDIEPGAEDFIRFDYYHDGTNYHVFALSVRNGVPLSQIDVIVTPSGTDSYLKIQRAGNVWTESYSFDNVHYTSRNFTLTTPFTVTKVGLFAANHGSATIPAHTAVIDYFFNTAAPIVKEDGKPTTLTTKVDPPGAGTVTLIDPAGQTNFACGDQITLSAASTNGLLFNGWSGATTSTANPVTFAYEMGAVVTANFVQTQNQNLLYLPLITKN